MRYAIVGNSGSGKSTLARKLGANAGIEPVDLDEIYWEPEKPGVRRDLAEASADLLSKLEGQECWIVEGCYEELIEVVLPLEPKLIWLEPGEAVCLEHCRNRPWEPHKYSSREAQDRNLEMLLRWVSDYYRRTGPMSYQVHKQLYANYDGEKECIGLAGDAGDGRD
ncbi:MAG: shikimate kinase [Pseudomonadota bacterium]